MMWCAASTPLRRGHDDVEHDHVGAETLGELYRRLAVGRLSHDLQAPLLQQRCQPLPKDRVVIGEQHPP